MKIAAQIILVLFMTMGLLTSCNNDDINPKPSDNFDRGAMLKDWADLIIIPGFDAYSQKLIGLVAAKDLFISDSNSDNLSALRTAHLCAYNSWQSVAMFDIGKAEEIGLRSFTNVYPTNVELIEEHVSSQSYNLILPSNFAAQGFPALDYLLFGIGDSEAEVLSQLGSNAYSNYLDDVVSRLADLTEEVIADWKGGYRETFISNDGASATASVDKLVNDFLFYYERYFRSGKIGLPAGVFSSDPIPKIVESYYSKVHSRELFLTGLDAVENFFIGRNQDLTENGKSLMTYLQHIEDNEIIMAGLVDDLLWQFSSARAKANQLSENFAEQIETDNSKMLETYDELNKAVVLMKVDMMQAFNIQVDYVDTDGD